MNKTALLFPGQGPQYVGMCKMLCREYSIARNTFDEASEALGLDMKKLCFDGPVAELDKTENTQPALLTAGVAATRVLIEEFAVIPDFSAGHSLGEYTALASCGAINFQDALQIVRKRGVFMEEVIHLEAGVMYAIGDIHRDVIEEECRKVSNENEFVCISNYNSPEQVVISGHRSAVENICKTFNKMGARVKFLNINIPSHCRLMKPAATKLKVELKKYSYNQLQWPVISNVTALPYRSYEDIVNNLATQFVRPVFWQDCMEYLQEQGVGIVIDMGPQSVLKKLAEKNTPGVSAFSFDVREDIKALQKMFSEVKQREEREQKIHNQAKVTLITKCLVAAVCTKNRNWNSEEYEKGVVEPYKKIKNLQQQLEKTEKQPTAEQMREALEMVRSVFFTKKVPIAEQKRRMDDILESTEKENPLNAFAIL